MSVKIEIDKHKVKMRVEAAFQSALPLVAEQALTDCNEYCKQDQGGLIASSQSASQPKEGKLVWNTPYAKKQYYTGKASHAKNPNATTMWCEKAKRAHGKDWEAIGNKAFKEGL